MGRNVVRKGIVGLTAAGLTFGALVGAGATPALAQTSCTWRVLDNPTPVYDNYWRFYEYKHTGDIVAGPNPDAIVAHDGYNYVLVYLAAGGVGWINRAKVSAQNC